MTNRDRRKHRVVALKRALIELKEEGFDEVNALIVHKKIQTFSKNEQANVRQVSNRLRCYRKILNLKVKGREPLLNQNWHGGGGKITVYEIL